MWSMVGNKLQRVYQMGQWPRVHPLEVSTVYLSRGRSRLIEESQDERNCSMISGVKIPNGVIDRMSFTHWLWDVQFGWLLLLSRVEQQGRGDNSGLFGEFNEILKDELCHSCRDKLNYVHHSVKLTTVPEVSVQFFNIKCKNEGYGH